MSPSSSGRATSSTGSAAEQGRTRRLAIPTATLAGFVHALRERGVPVSTGRFHDFLVALDAVDLTRRDLVHLTGRCTLCASPDHLDIYDEVFERWFEGLGEGPEPGPEAPEEQVVLAMEPDESGEGEEEEELDIPSVSSSVEVLRRRDFAELSPEEHEEIRRMLRSLPWVPEERMTRRRLATPSGVVDRRRTVRTAMRSAGEVRALRRSRRRTRPRRVVLLIDVSGSMREYAVAFLRFAHVAVRRRQGPTEAFALGTRLTRLTPQLEVRDPEQAMRQTAQVIEDWHGGTRLGDGVKSFLDDWGQRGAARGAVVVVFSDGWERGDPTFLGGQMGRLARLAHRVIWANPRKSRPGYEPRVGGIAASLPHVDHFVDASNIESLAELVSLMGVLGARRG